MERNRGREEQMERRESSASIPGQTGITTLALGILAVSLALIIAPIFLGAKVMIQMVLGGFGIGGLIIGSILIIIAKLYVKTSANVAFYRTGQGKPLVIIDGGAIVVPVVHELIAVSLEVMKLEVPRAGGDSLICRDCLRADVTAEFYIKVRKDEAGVMAAATTLGRDAMNAAAIKDRLMEKLVSALRTVAATMDLSDLNQNREGFAKSVQEAVTKDIEPNGLLLETVTISRLDQTDVKFLKEDNVFDAQGLRKGAEITAAAKVKRNQITREAELAITERDVTTRKAVLEQQRDVAFAEAEQKTQVANRQAEKAAETEKFAIAQSEEVAKRGVEKDRAVKAAELQREAKLADESQKTGVAEVERDRGIKAAEIQREAALVVEDQKKATAEVARTQAVEVALREKEVAVAEAETKRAETQAQQRLAEAKEQEAAQKVLTAAQVEQASRQKQIAIIAAEKEGQEALIKQNKTADAEAYTVTRKAQAGKEAAENEAAATIRLAEAELEAKKRKAEGDQAVQMVPVQVAAAQVEVNRAQVEVLNRELEAKDTHQQAAIALEIEKLRIGAGQVVGVEFAKAIGAFMANGSFNIFGSPETLASMNNQFAEGLGINQILSGLKEGSPLLGGLIDKALEAGAAGLDAAKAKADEAAGKKKPGKDSVPPTVG
jgi:uncharacterized membrane protein YqiK